LLRLHEQQGQALLFGSPQLIGLVTAALLFAGRFEQAADCIGQLARFLPQPSAALERQLIARWQAQQGWLMHLLGRMEAAHEHFQQALDELGADAWPARLLCLSGLTQQALLRGELDVAHAINRDALCLARAQGSLVFEGLLELDHAQILEQRGAPGRAEALLANIESLLNELPARPAPLLGRIALHRGRLALTQGHDERAGRLFENGLDDCLRSHDKRVLYAFLGQAQLAANRRDYDQAFVRLRDAERLMQQRQIPDTVYRGVLLQFSSHFWLQQGRPALAHETLTRVLRHYQGPNARQAPPATLELISRVEYLLILATVQLGSGNHDGLERLRQMLNLAHAGGMNALKTELQLVTAEVLWLGGSTAEAIGLLQDGRRMVSCFQAQQTLRDLGLRQAVMLEAQTPALPADQLFTSDSNTHLLSQRELEVLKLIALGHSNQQIADELFISLHTVKTHARRIHGKLGVERRTQAVAKAKLLGVWG